MACVLEETSSHVASAAVCSIDWIKVACGVNCCMWEGHKWLHRSSPQLKAQSGVKVAIRNAWTVVNNVVINVMMAMQWDTSKWPLKEHLGRPSENGEKSSNVVVVIIVIVNVVVVAVEEYHGLRRPILPLDLVRAGCVLCLRIELTAMTESCSGRTMERL